MPKVAMKKAALAAKEKITCQIDAAASPTDKEQDPAGKPPAEQMEELTDTALYGGAQTLYTGGKKLVRTISRRRQVPGDLPEVPAGGPDVNGATPYPKEAPEPLHTPPEAPRGTQNNSSGQTPAHRGNSVLWENGNDSARGKGRVPQSPKKGDFRDMNQAVGNGLHSNATGGRKATGVKERRGLSPKGMSSSVPKEAGDASQRIKTSAPAAAQARVGRKKAMQATARAQQFARQTAEKAVQGARKIGHAVGSAIKGFVAALKTLVASLSAGGGLALAVILLICLIAFVMGSSFGIFFGAEPTGYGTPIQEVASALNEEFYADIQKTIDEVEHDVLEFEASDGVTAIRWEDVFAVFAASITGSADGTEAVTMDEAKTATLRRIIWEMNEVSHTTETVSKEVEVPVENEDGEVELETRTITETTLTIHILHRTPAEMAAVYGFNARQNEAAALLAQPQYASLWAKLLGGFTNGTGEIITPDTDWTGTNIFAWPLPQSFSITSRFGYRADPFTGQMSYHCGTDIAAPYGTPILAAAGGTVTIANGTDPWGGSYGYHIKISHNSAYDTLYAHCSSICVTAGQQVAQGQVIGYVGSTGNSTGNHLHFEVWANGQRTDVLNYFK